MEGICVLACIPRVSRSLAFYFEADSHDHLELTHFTVLDSPSELCRFEPLHLLDGFSSLLNCVAHCFRKALV